MTRRTFAVSLLVLAIFVVAIVGAMSFTTSSGGDNVHTMPGGMTMTGTEMTP